VAVRLGAQELVLFKSAPLHDGCSRIQASRSGLVDPAFEEASRGLVNVFYVDLRTDPDRQFRLD
jgi:hypothetical protein